MQRDFYFWVILFKKLKTSGINRELIGIFRLVFGFNRKQCRALKEQGLAGILVFFWLIWLLWVPYRKKLWANGRRDSFEVCAGGIG